MTERIDHAAESEQIAFGLNEAVIAHEGITDATIIATAIDAHRHATLALVEQQRIANLIALSQAQDGNGWQAEEPLAALFTYVSSEDYNPDSDNGLRIHGDIKKGLGL